MEAPDRPLALIVSYNGAAYAGFQRQSGQVTVQSRLEEALAVLAARPVPVRGAGRTDAGVHAAGQVIDIRLPPGVRIPTARLPLALIRRLPPDIAATACFDVPAAFHARLSALGKRYRYLIWRGPVVPPLWRGLCWHWPGPLDAAAMRQGAAALVGRHDLAAFAGAARPVRDATRTIFAVDVVASGPWVAIEVEADGFLYRMVRALAGTLLEVGRGARDPGAVAGIVAGRQRAAAGPSLPPQGLHLLWVRYPPALGLPPPGDAAWAPAPGPASPVELGQRCLDWRRPRD